MTRSILWCLLLLQIHLYFRNKLVIIYSKMPITFQWLLQKLPNHSNITIDIFIIKSQSLIFFYLKVSHKNYSEFLYFLNFYFCIEIVMYNFINQFKKHWRSQWDSKLFILKHSFKMIVRTRILFWYYYLNRN